MHSLVLCAIFGFAARDRAARRSAPPARRGGGDRRRGRLAGDARRRPDDRDRRARARRRRSRSRSSCARARCGRSRVGGVIGVLVVVGAAWASLGDDAREQARRSTGRAGTCVGRRRQASAVQFVWDSNYDGIRLPAQEDGRPAHRRARGAELLANHDARPLHATTTGSRISSGSTRSTRGSARSSWPQLVPARAARPPSNWLEQHVRIEALVDDHLAAAGTPVALDARRLGTVFLLSGGRAPRARPDRAGADATASGATRPTPRRVRSRSAPLRYPPAAGRFLEIDGRRVPPVRRAGRDRVVDAIFADPSYAAASLRSGPSTTIARRVAGRAKTPYGAVLALESWLRQTGGFRYDESPPHTTGPAARRLRDADEGGLLPALRRRDGG